MDLFSKASSQALPLAERMRPKSLDEVLGQTKLVGEDGFLRALMGGSQDLPSLVFQGPPGTGKTTLARILAQSKQHEFVLFSAVLGGVKDLREIVKEAKARLSRGLGKTLLFVDEIHRFSKSQQDAFLPHVEDGTIILIGATTENPSFALNAALLSRCRVLRLDFLEDEAIFRLLERALQDERGYGGKEEVARDVLWALSKQASGDARRALNDLEIAIQWKASGQPLGLENLEKIFSKSPLFHDREGDAHYDVVSAMIKSLRGSDADAGLYYAARLLEAGESPRFIFRRLIIFASEDIGNADPRALGMAVDGAKGFEIVGMPEGRIILGQVLTYLATAPKSNASYLAFDAAIQDVKKRGALPVPLKLQNAPTALMKAEGRAKGYRYPHDFGGWVGEHYLPEALKGTSYYQPKGEGYEKYLKERLERWRSLRDKGLDK